jgi:two-component system OmpR family sensor kinase
MVVFWLLAIGLSIRVMQHEFDEIFDSAQQETTERLLALILDDMDQRTTTDPHGIAMLNTAASREYLTYQVRDTNGKIVLRSNDAPSEPFRAPLETGFHDTDTARIYTEKTTDGALFLQVADRFKNRREAVRESAVTLLIPLIALIPASIFAIWFIVGRALKPLDTLRQDIAHQGWRQSGCGRGGGLPKELKPIARSVNLLLGRLRRRSKPSANSPPTAPTNCARRSPARWRRRSDWQTSFRRDRRAFGAPGRDLAGQSRTPCRETAATVRAEAGIGGSATATDLRPVLDMIVTDYERDSRSRGRLRYTAEPDATLVRNADVDAFGIVIRNVIENALIHGDPEMPVSVSSAAQRHHQRRQWRACGARGDMAMLKKRFRRGKTNADGIRPRPGDCRPHRRADGWHARAAVAGSRRGIGLRGAHDPAHVSGDFGLQIVRNGASRRRASRTSRTRMIISFDIGGSAIKGGIARSEPTSRRSAGTRRPPTISAPSSIR